MERKEAIEILEDLDGYFSDNQGRDYDEAFRNHTRKEITMKNDKQFEDALKKIGEVAGVGEDWYEIGEAEKGEDGGTRYGIYAKTDEIAEKVGKVFDRIIADKGGDE